MIKIKSKIYDAHVYNWAEDDEDEVTNTDEIVVMNFGGYKTKDSLRKFLESCDIRVHKIVEVKSDEQNK